MIKIQSKFYFILLIPVIVFFLITENDYVFGDNIIDFDHYRVMSGNPTIFSNSSGIYLSGSGDVFVKIQFNGTMNSISNSTLFSYSLYNSTLQFINNPIVDMVESSQPKSICIELSDVTWEPVSISPVSDYFMAKINGTINHNGGSIIMDNIKFERWQGGPGGTTITSPPPSDSLQTPICSVLGFPSDGVYYSQDWITRGGGWIDEKIELFPNTYYTTGYKTQDTIFDNFFIYASLTNGTVKLGGDHYTSKILPPDNFRIDIGNQLVNLKWDCPSYDGIGNGNECTNILRFELYENDVSIKNFTGSTQIFVYHDIPLNQDNYFKVRAYNVLGNMSSFSPILLIDSIEKPLIDNLTPDSLTRTDNSITIIFPSVISTTQTDTFEIIRNSDPSVKVYRVSSDYDSFTNEDGITENTEPCYQLRVRAFLGWSNFTNIQCVDSDTIITKTIQIIDNGVNTTPGSIDVDSKNTFRINPISYKRIDNIPNNSVVIEIQYPSSFTLECNSEYKFKNTNKNHTNLNNELVNSNTKQTLFNFTNVNSEIISLRCYDTETGSESIYVITNNESLPFLDLLDKFTDGTLGTKGQIGYLDMVTLIVVVFSMIGFNRKNHAMGVIFNAIIIGVTAWYGIIEIPTIMVGITVTVAMFVVFASRRSY